MCYCAGLFVVAALFIASLLKRLKQQRNAGSASGTAATATETKPPL
jgi:hypothetical protein